MKNFSMTATSMVLVAFFCGSTFAADPSPAPSSASSATDSQGHQVQDNKGGRVLTNDAGTKTLTSDDGKKVLTADSADVTADSAKATADGGSKATAKKKAKKAAPPVTDKPAQ